MPYRPPYTNWPDPYERPRTAAPLPPLPTSSPVLGGSQPAGATPLEGIPPLGPVAPPRQYEKWEPVDMDWMTLTSRVSPEAMAQLFQYWETGAMPPLAGEILGAGLDWYWGFQRGGPPDLMWDEYAEDLKDMYEGALKSAGYKTPRAYVPNLSGELRYTGMGPWYNYGRYKYR